jgi:hypothetical protein
VGRDEEALAARRESHEMLVAMFPDPHPYTAASRSSMGTLLARLGRFDEAEVLLLESVAEHRIVLTPDNPNLAFPLTGWAGSTCSWVATKRPSEC